MFYIKKPDIFGYIIICFVLACIGRLCTPKCPQCNENCTCDAGACDDVFGCVTTGK